MWIFTKYGFYSIVQDNNDKNLFKVRARKKEDLEELQKKVDGISLFKIHKDERADYRFRIFITSEKLVEIMVMFSTSIDYSNFKDSIYRNKAQKDKLDSYHQIWEVMYEYQNINQS